MYQYVGISMMVVGFLWALWFAVKYGLTYLPKSSKVTPLDRPTQFLPDEPAPQRTPEYLKMIQEEAPKATEKEWWVYATMGLSAMAVVRSERNRLGGGP